MRQRDEVGVRTRVPYADPGTPDTRGPWHLLWWLVWRQRGRVLRGALWGSLWMVGLMLPPYLIAQAIDRGLRANDPGALLVWATAVLVVGLVNAFLGIMRHRTMTMIRVDSAYRTVQVLVRRMAELGAALPKRVAAGEVSTVGSADLFRVAQTLTITGPGFGAVVACAVVAVLLFGISPALAAVVLVGVPVLLVVVGPLLGRLDRAETAYRERQGAVTALAADIVGGLRVLCGIGGKGVFADRYRARSRELRDNGFRVGAITSRVQALGVCLPVVFLAAVVWISARMTASGALTVGEMVAVYGYVAALVVPVSAFVEGADDLTRGVVSARRVIAVLDVRPDLDDPEPPVPGPAADADLHDPASGLVVPGGRFCALVATGPAEALAVVDRLARYADSAAAWGGVPLGRMSLTEVRARIVVADSDAHLFAGALRDVVAPAATPDDDAVRRAVHTAAAEDLVAALPEGLDSPVAAQGRDLSGGQRQRLRLVRALLADPDVLLLVEPTSAVDAHTEARIAGRLRAAREGGTTLVVTSSPLVLDRADHVSLLVGGRVAASGTHARLLATDDDYRRLVHRDDDLAGEGARR
ncbi:ABC transporter ATP-binding protein [Saccharothrix violaceirubra]|uniref:ABC-type multidrug transport system fused ATPase/permease subunit n=1 Tax=Saccharothrix violaceirubra TaxID=413306 RepID=A0A7W7WXK5_9PSEU|nr:ABC transporter ATP-binding protein [Saccharothrix violaceirubra]MBB4966723.1 ABC-type multidrug transport system fused ATPase/permease subunit [Saccharothrix violaceirubra]